MKILLTGGTGQIGFELMQCLQGKAGIHIVAPDREQMDLADLDQVRNMIRTVTPDLIINAAAYTAVDKAESEPALALRINGKAPAIMAEEAKKLGAAMIHYSTDYVFDGSKRAPYTEDDQPSPINVYGSSKLSGEQAIRQAGINYLILRTSWVYGNRGKNFLLTMLRLAQEREELRIVDDQHGSPTWSRSIAEKTAEIIAQIGKANNAGVAQQWWQDRSGLYHLTAPGQTTWFGFTRAIMQNAHLEKTPLLTAIGSKEYPSPARRPVYSVMSSGRLAETFGALPSWQDALALCQAELQARLSD